MLFVFDPRPTLPALTKLGHDHRRVVSLWCIDVMLRLIYAPTDPQLLIALFSEREFHTSVRMEGF